jgi:hypothetical protein
VQHLNFETNNLLAFLARQVLTPAKTLREPEVRAPCAYKSAEPDALRVRQSPLSGNPPTALVSPDTSVGRHSSSTGSTDRCATVGKPFRQSLMGETTPVALLGETPRPHWLPKTSTTTPGTVLPNALARLGGSYSYDDFAQESESPLYARGGMKLDSGKFLCQLKSLSTKDKQAIISSGGSKHVSLDL